MMPHEPQRCCGEAHAHTQHKTQHKPQCTVTMVLSRWWPGTVTTARPKVGSRVPAHVTPQPSTECSESGVVFMWTLSSHCL
eukprot:2412787-Rhodomonas_salina.1